MLCSIFNIQCKCLNVLEYECITTKQLAIKYTLTKTLVLFIDYQYICIVGFVKKECNNKKNPSNTQPFIAY